MKKNLGAKMFFTPLPVLVIGTYNSAGIPDAMNVAWAGQCGPKAVALNIGSHQTTENLKLKKCFTLAYANRDNEAQADFVGLVSGRKDKDKIKETGWKTSKSSRIDAPVFEDFPLTLECRVTEMKEVSESEFRVVGEVINMIADQHILNEKGQIDIDRLQPILLDDTAGVYRIVGEKVGSAFHDGKQFKSISKDN
ncbi:flavin reductase family protein [Prevotella cerevisiae]|uniref:Flavin reductase family protein n=1 Tax=Segatella cerevisiae TaxID=2053716 RepID=A0ABT1BZK7_9BACT|nr:flavin reductase family protein [Segatella cerevisiae]MCO6026519.1 flavin reductase family protein [Segatella cerevisiae]